MSIATPLRTQIEAIKARIDALAATATAEDIVMLSKAIEAVGGQSSVFDVMAVAEEKAAEIEASAENAAVAATATVNTAKDSAMTAITQAKNAALAQVNPLPTLAAAQAAVLSF